MSREQEITLSNGKRIHLPGYFFDALYLLKGLPMVDQFHLLDYDDTEVMRLVEYQYELLNRNLKGRKWSFPEYDEKVPIDDEFIDTFLPVDVNKKTLFRRIRERRLPLAQVIEINKFFKNEMVKR